MWVNREGGNAHQDKEGGQGIRASQVPQSRDDGHDGGEVGERDRHHPAQTDACHADKPPGPPAPPAGALLLPVAQSRTTRDYSTNGLL